MSDDTNPLAGFTPLAITMNLDELPWDDLDRDSLAAGQAERIGILPNGTDAGKPSVAIYGTTEDGMPVLLQTTWNLLYSAAVAFEARYGPAQ